MQPILVDVPDSLEGEHVLLRRYVDADAATLHQVLQEAQEHLRPWLPGHDQPRTLEQVLTTLRRGQAQWALRESFTMGLWVSQTGALVGEVRLRPTQWAVPAFDISYWTHPAAQGHGYVSEAVQLLTTLAFGALQARRVALACEPRNVRSRRVAERLGFALEGQFRNADCGPDGGPCDLLIFSLIPEDYTVARLRWHAERR